MHSGPSYTASLVHMMERLKGINLGLCHLALPAQPSPNQEWCTVLSLYDSFGLGTRVVGFRYRLSMRPTVWCVAHWPSREETEMFEQAREKKGRQGGFREHNWMTFRSAHIALFIYLQLIVLLLHLSNITM